MDTRLITFLKEKFMSGEADTAAISLNLIIGGLRAEEAKTLIDSWQEELNNLKSEK